MLIGYARVSRQDQDTALQLKALRAAGLRRIREEKASGIGPRVVLEQLLEDLREGDVLVVYKLDRIARTTLDLLSILDRVAASGASLRSLTESIDTATPSGRLALSMLASVAQFERENMRERSLAGMAAARANGIHPGAPRRLDAKGEAKLIALYRTGKYSKRELAKLHRISVATLYRIFARNDVDPVPYRDAA